MLLHCVGLTVLVGCLAAIVYGKTLRNSGANAGNFKATRRSFFPHELESNGL